ncbi:MAG: ABC transporter ATP-binding protein [Sphingomonadales bacterium]|nr:ABC transporter ATP-binding protein [Sphingomonadales bacterium]
MTAALTVEGLDKAWSGGRRALDQIDLRVEEGEFVVVVGPSGCGKSTLLRVIAGLEELDAGRILIAGEDVTGRSPAARGVAMVFQSYALYPHLTVRENIAFPLRRARMPRSEIGAAVNEAARMLGLEDLLDRKPAALSGGQRQRVAIGRAIVRSPKLFLFDEPLSNLDAAMRTRMRQEFAALHRQLKTATLYVTHDQIEALTLADRIVVLRDGRIEQIGRAQDVYDRPANRFVAGFIGSPRMNLMEARVDGMNARLPDGQAVNLPFAPATVGLTVGVRPEHLSAEIDGPFRGRVTMIERLGSEITVSLATPAGATLLWQTRAHEPVVLDQAVTLGAAPGTLHLFADDGARLEATR